MRGIAELRMCVGEGDFEGLYALMQLHHQYAGRAGPRILWE